MKSPISDKDNLSAVQSIGEFMSLQPRCKQWLKPHIYRGEIIVKNMHRDCGCSKWAGLFLIYVGLYSQKQEQNNKETNQVSL